MLLSQPCGARWSKDAARATTAGGALRQCWHLAVSELAKRSCAAFDARPRSETSRADAVDVLLASVLQAASPQRSRHFGAGLGAFRRWSACSTPSTTPRRSPNACEMARRILLALACIGAAEAGSALAEGTTPLTAANFDDFVEGALAAGKTAMVRFIASEG